VELLIGNPAKAKELLGWLSKTKLPEPVNMMIKSDYEKVKVRGY